MKTAARATALSMLLDQRLDAKADVRVLYEKYGDSTVAGATKEGEITRIATVTEPQALARLLKTSRVTVVNKGIGGTTAADWLNATAGVPRRWNEQMRLSEAQVISITLGINDVALLHIQPDQFAQNLDDMVRSAQANHKTVVLITSSPVDYGWNMRLARLVEAERTLAKRLGLILIDQYSFVSSLPHWEMLLSDRIHPTENLYATMAQFEYASLCKAFSFVACHQG